MATIIGRAEETYKSLKDSSNRLSQCDYLLCTGAYIRGATEQREIDINKACDLIEQVIKQNNDILLSAHVSDPDGLIAGVLVQQFREVMLNDK